MRRFLFLCVGKWGENKKRRSTGKIPVSAAIVYRAGSRPEYAGREKGKKGSKKPRLGVVRTPADHFEWAAVYFSL